MLLRTTLFVAALISTGSVANALSPRRILLYQQENSVTYTSEIGEKSVCRMSLNETETVEMIGETNDYIRVRFPKGRMKGCFADTVVGRDIDVGWIPKKEVTYGDNDNTPVQLITPPPADPLAVPCPPANGSTTAPMSEPANVRATMDALRAKGSGLKSINSFERYKTCYPLTKNGEAMYQTAAPVMDKIAGSMAFRKNGVDYTVNPLLFRCLIWRESQYDPNDVSWTGATGLGQHTNVNILHIKNRLETKGSWERQLWDQTFSMMKRDPEGAALMKKCPRTAYYGATPTFNDKEDAKCPLNSLVASAIYNLQIQETLMRSSKVKSIRREDELNYLTAIGATYNLGDGVAGKAVSDLTVGNWLPAIQNRTPNPGKSKEVANHITALRNCMKEGSNDPMAANDQKSRSCDYPDGYAASKSAPSKSTPKAPAAVPVSVPRPAAK